MIVGAKGNKVIELQTYLTDFGYRHELAPEGIDGKFGPHTKNAVMAFQRDTNQVLANQKDDLLSVDGKLDRETWSELCEQYSMLKEMYMGLPTNNIPN